MLDANELMNLFSIQLDTTRVIGSTALRAIVKYLVGLALLSPLDMSQANILGALRKTL
jgi:hypothetical protein